MIEKLQKELAELLEERDKIEKGIVGKSPEDRGYLWENNQWAIYWKNLEIESEGKNEQGT